MNKEYQEKISSGLLSILAGAAGVFSLGMFAYIQLSDSTDIPAALWTLPAVGLLLLFVAINFASLVIKVSPRGVSAGYGVFRHSVPAADISGYYLDEASHLAYGGFSIRFGRNNGKRKVVYNTVGTPGVVIQQHSKPDQEFVFSTKNPEAVIKALQDIQTKR
jgi:hypothetical protein